MANWNLNSAHNNTNYHNDYPNDNHYNNPDDFDTDMRRRLRERLRPERERYFQRERDERLLEHQRERQHWQRERDERLRDHQRERQQWQQERRQWQSRWKDTREQQAFSLYRNEVRNPSATQNVPGIGPILSNRMCENADSINCFSDLKNLRSFGPKRTAGVRNHYHYHSQV